MFLLNGKNAYICHPKNGELAQLARALAWHARGRRFDSDILHRWISDGGFLISDLLYFMFSTSSFTEMIRAEKKAKEVKLKRNLTAMNTKESQSFAKKEVLKKTFAFSLRALSNLCGLLF